MNETPFIPFQQKGTFGNLGQPVINPFSTPKPIIKNTPTILPPQQLLGKQSVTFNPNIANPVNVVTPPKVVKQPVVIDPFPKTTFQPQLKQQTFVNPFTSQKVEQVFQNPKPAIVKPINVTPIDQPVVTFAAPKIITEPVQDPTIKREVTVSPVTPVNPIVQQEILGSKINPEPIIVTNPTIKPIDIPSSPEKTTVPIDTFKNTIEGQLIDKQYTPQSRYIATINNTSYIKYIRATDKNG
ncbi:MAG: hypothetical protein ACXWE7_13980, partial [Nitrososphaeraceae archaeon]